MSRAKFSFFKLGITIFLFGVGVMLLPHLSLSTGDNPGIFNVEPNNFGPGTSSMLTIFGASPNVNLDLFKLVNEYDRVGSPSRTFAQNSLNWAQSNSLGFFSETVTNNCSNDGTGIPVKGLRFEDAHVETGGNQSNNLVVLKDCRGDVNVYQAGTADCAWTVSGPTGPVSITNLGDFGGTVSGRTTNFKATDGSYFISGYAPGTLTGSASQVLDPGGSITYQLNCAAVIPTFTIGPLNASVNPGQNQNYTGFYDPDGSGPAQPQAVNAQSVSWHSDYGAVAVIGSNGVATGVGQGVTIIHGTYQGIDATATLTVNAGAAPAFTIEPSDTTVVAGGTPQQYTGFYDADGSGPGQPQAVSAQSVNWISSAPGIATINNTGIANGISAGTATITGIYQGIGNTATLHVATALAPTFTITPPNAVINIGATQQYIGHYDPDGPSGPQAEQLVTLITAWSSGAPSVATINNGGGLAGLATGVSAGTTIITGVYQGITATATLNVNATQGSPDCALSVPPSKTIYRGTSDSFMVSATNGSSIAVSRTNIPSGITMGQFSPSPINNGQSSSMTITVPGNALIGARNFTVSCSVTSGGVTVSHNYNVSLNVTFIPTYTVAVSPSSVSKAWGETAVYQITVGNFSLAPNTINLSIGWSAGNGGLFDYQFDNTSLAVGAGQTALTHVRITPHQGTLPANYNFTIHGLSASGEPESSSGQITVTGAPGSPSHLECLNNSCTRINGTGTDACSPEGSVCPPSATHLTCNASNNSCESVAGPGSNSCSPAGSNCAPVTHNGCVAGSCQVISGPGANDCNACGGTNPTHLDCVNNSCAVVTGGGSDQCSPQGSQCASPTFTLAVSPANISRTPGNEAVYQVTVGNTSLAPTTVNLSLTWQTGGSYFMTAFDNTSVSLGVGQSVTVNLHVTSNTFEPTGVYPFTVHGTTAGGQSRSANSQITSVGPGGTHLACQNNSCTRVSGGGTDACSPEGSTCASGSGSHLSCVSNACAVVNGVGTDDCSACGGPGGGGGAIHLSCVNNSCAIVSGPGSNSCTPAGSSCAAGCSPGQTNGYSVCVGRSCVAQAGCGVSNCVSAGNCIPPPSCTMSVAPQIMDAGNGATITWNCISASSCSISSCPGLSAGANCTQGGSVSASGSQLVTPPSTTTYIVNCSGGASAQATVRVRSVIETGGQ